MDRAAAERFWQEMSVLDQAGTVLLVLFSLTIFGLFLVCGRLRVGNYDRTARISSICWMSAGLLMVSYSLVQFMSFLVTGDYFYLLLTLFCAYIGYTCIRDFFKLRRAVANWKKFLHHPK